VLLGVAARLRSWSQGEAARLVVAVALGGVAAVGVGRASRGDGMGAVGAIAALSRVALQFLARRVQGCRARARLASSLRAWRGRRAGKGGRRHATRGWACGRARVSWRGTGGVGETAPGDALACESRGKEREREE
jgi:hypothetical protein